jgi:hypothetical protein
MKSSDKPEISKKWWSSEKPGDVKGVELEKALAAAEKALSEQEKRCDKDSIGACLAALADLSAVVDKTVKKELDKKKHKDPISVLGKFDALIGSEVKRLEAAQAVLAEEGGEDEEGEDEDEGKLFEKDYLYKMVKMMKSTGKELNFGFGLDTKAPESSVLLLSRKGKPDKLFRALKRTGNFSNRCLCYGRALCDPDNGKVLLFRLDDGAGEPPQIIKLGRVFLRKDKSLRFRKLKVVLPGGQTLIDDEPDVEDGEVGQVAEGESAGTSADTSGRRRLSDEERGRIRKEIEQIEKRLDEVSAMEPATV